MQDTEEAVIVEAVHKQRAYFATGITKSVDFRMAQLKKLRSAIEAYQPKLEEAIYKDFRKSKEEFYLTEISIVLGELKHHIKHLRGWAKPRRVKTPIHLAPSTSKVMQEPLGCSLIIGPWNYPFQLLMNPLVGAISAGCCAIMKPSPYTPNIAMVMQELIEETFSHEYITMFQGRRTTNGRLLAQRFDHIFFTGSPFLGHIVMEAAAKHLTPLVLELGGKSPCIVDKDANLRVAAKRIAWGKCINAGQTCIAPDYLFIHSSVRDKFLELLKAEITAMYGENPKESPYFPRIVNDNAFEGLFKFVSQGPVYWGGEVDKDERYLSPTILSPVTPEHPIMQDEIFGPILPVLTFEDINEPIQYANSHEKPLAFYYFGSPAKGKKVFEKTTSGGGCINDVLLHIANHNLPFGGVGNSGMGKYHGKTSFLAFSNSRAVVSTTTKIDVPFRYTPYKFWSLIKRLL